MNVPRTLGASGDLEARWAGLRTLSDALFRGPSVLACDQEIW
jgi:hypothetical protein